MANAFTLRFHVVANMECVVLGGTGVMGSFVVEHLAESGVFERVVAVDYDDSRREEIEALDERVAFAAVDVTDAGALEDAIEDADVVVNCVGPFYRFAERVLA